MGSVEAQHLITKKIMSPHLPKFPALSLLGALLLTLASTGVLAADLPKTRAPLNLSLTPEDIHQAWGGPLPEDMAMGQGADGAGKGPVGGKGNGNRHGQAQGAGQHGSGNELPYGAGYEARQLRNQGGAGFSGGGGGGGGSPRGRR